MPWYHRKYGEYGRQNINQVSKALKDLWAAERAEAEAKARELEEQKKKEREERAKQREIILANMARRKQKVTRRLQKENDAREHEMFRQYSVLDKRVDDSYTYGLKHEIMERKNNLAAKAAAMNALELSNKKKREEERKARDEQRAQKKKEEDDEEADILSSMRKFGLVAAAPREVVHKEELISEDIYNVEVKYLTNDKLLSPSSPTARKTLTSSPGSPNRKSSTIINGVLVPDLKRYPYCKELKCTNLGPSGCCKLSQALTPIIQAGSQNKKTPGLCSRLRHLKISSNGIRAKGAMALFKALGAGATPYLVSLDVSRNQIGSSGCDKFAEALKAGAIQNCQVILLRQCGIPDEGACTIAHALFQKNTVPRLRELNVSFNYIKTRGAKALFHALQVGNHKDLLVLNVSKNNVDKAGIKYFAGLRRDMLQF
eukprot:g99.t1